MFSTSTAHEYIKQLFNMVEKFIIIYPTHQRYQLRKFTNRLIAKS